MKRWIAAAAGAALAAGPAGAVRIGTFDAVRGGTWSFGAATGLSHTRATVTAALPGATFLGTSTLDAGFFGSVDFVMLSSGAGGNAGIAPLTAAERAALRNFVLGGGSALLFVDNDTFAGAASDASNESLIDAFGFDVAGTASFARNVTAVGAGNPITGGPFGTVTSATFHWPGGFDRLGPGAVPLGTVDALGTAGIAWIPRGALGPGSGGVVLFSDTSFAVNGYTSASGDALLQNAAAYAAVPEPATITLLAGGLAGALRRRRRG